MLSRTIIKYRWVIPAWALLLWVAAFGAYSGVHSQDRPHVPCSQQSPPDKQPGESYKNNDPSQQTATSTLGTTRCQTEDQDDRQQDDRGNFISRLFFDIRITDLLIALFTGLLWLATINLWEATKKIVQSSEDTAKRQLRAYVFVDSISLIDGGQLAAPANPEAFPPGDRQPKGRPGVLIVIRNSGQTPAYEVAHWGDIDVKLVQDEETIPIPGPQENMPKTYIATNTPMNKGLWLTRILTPQEIEDIRLNRRAVYVFGRIDYLDTFKIPRFTIYRLRYSGIYPPLPSHSFTYCQNGNRTE